MKILNRNLRQPVVEFLVVVVGIITALSRDNWNSERIDRDREAEYLHRLVNDIDSDVTSFLRTGKSVGDKQRDLKLVSQFARNQDGFEENIVPVVQALINSVGKLRFARQENHQSSD